MNPQGLKRRNSGFSLVELMVMIIIVSILVLMATRFFSGAPEDAKSAKATIEMRQIVDACVDFNGKNGKFPRDFSELVAAGYYSSAPDTPFGTRYSLDGNYVVCPTAVGKMNMDIGALRKSYNKTVIFDEFNDAEESAFFWSNAAAFANIDFAGDSPDRFSSLSGTYIKSATKLVSKGNFSSCDITVSALLPSRNPENRALKLANSIYISIGTIFMKWENTKTKPQARVTFGTGAIDDEYVGDMNSHVFKISLRRKRKSAGRAYYYLDGVPLNPSGATVSIPGGPLELEMSKDIHIERVEALLVD
ncbi:MAG: hypothetical protein CVV64_02040 [Candidatus Wallbacteria bacterium HGW-Wallbacteria-1]|jgi:competence protein ComGC|uniref:Type II secretion system protein GspG C-terminal domain-containing protein n=1 Tax=Candidatus Wallbacteria bacterium HGW-Wallbacteria-1 TaxID=2013854 RepID=A0A2N1PV36_9BACT|nr:MAG: hypothetical protein CVV64_02040 [Candidatus Wallbacteria bacterium HGW-Wallbacteria-1]